MFDSTFFLYAIWLIIDAPTPLVIPSSVPTANAPSATSVPCPSRAPATPPAIPSPTICAVSRVFAVLSFTYLLVLI